MRTVWQQNHEEPNLLDHVLHVRRKRIDRRAQLLQIVLLVILHRAASGRECFTWGASPRYARSPCARRIPSTRTRWHVCPADRRWWQRGDVRANATRRAALDVNALAKPIDRLLRAIRYTHNFLPKLNQRWILLTASFREWFRKLPVASDFSILFPDSGQYEEILLFQIFIRYIFNYTFSHCAHIVCI